MRNKLYTDMNFDKGIHYLIDRLTWDQRLHAVISTHNLGSIMQAAQIMYDYNIPPFFPRLIFAQYKGVGEHLTNGMKYLGV